MFSNGKRSLWDSKKEVRSTDNWSVVILKPLRTEVRNALIRTLTEVFAMSEEEAVNVVSNTPNILVDELNQRSAIEIKNAFRSTGAEIFLTHDSTVKAKCYRTVWPEKPNFTFAGTPELAPAPEPRAEPQPAEALEVEAPEGLHEEAESLISHSLAPEAESDTTEEEALTADIKPMASRAKEPEAVAGEKAVTDSAFITAQAKKSSMDLRQEFDRWKDKYESWKNSFSGLIQDVESLRKEKQSLRKTVENTNELISDREKQIHEQKGLLTSVEEKYRKLQEEFFQNRTDFEKRLGTMTQDLASWKSQTGEMLDKMVSLERDKQTLDQAFSNQRKQYEDLEREYYRARTEFENRVDESCQEIEKWKHMAETTSQRLNELEKTRATLESALAESQERYAKLEKDYKESRKLSRIKGSLSAEEFDEWQQRERLMAQRLETLEKMQIQVIEDLKRRSQVAPAAAQEASPVEAGVQALTKNQEKIEKLAGKSKKSSPKK